MTGVAAVQTARKHALTCTATEVSTGFGTYLAQVSHIRPVIPADPLVVATNSCLRAVRFTLESVVPV
jgi:hypothetical protein